MAPTFERHLQFREMSSELRFGFGFKFEFEGGKPLDKLTDIERAQTPK